MSACRFASTRLCVRRSSSISYQSINQSNKQTVNQSNERSFSAYSRPKRPRRPKPVQEPEPEPAAEPVEQPFVRPHKNSPPHQVTVNQMLEYQDRSSVYSRMTLLTSRIHAAFALYENIRIQQGLNPTNNQENNPPETLVESIRNIWRLNQSLHPYIEPYPAWAYRLSIKLLAKIDAKDAFYALFQYHDRSINSLPADPIHKQTPFPLSPELCVVIAEALSAEGKPELIAQLIDLMEKKWKLPMTIEIATAWLESIQLSNNQSTEPSSNQSSSPSASLAVVRKARESIVDKLRERRIPLSSRCYELMIESLDHSKMNSIMEMLQEWNQSISQGINPPSENQSLNMTPGIAGALKRALIDQSLTHPNQYVPELLSLLSLDHSNDKTTEQSMDLIHALMSFYGNDPEHVHCLFDQLTNKNTQSYSLLINSYGNRSNSQSSIDVKDVIRIDRLFARLTEQLVKPDVATQLVMLRVAAQRGDGDSVAKGVTALIDQSNAQSTDQSNNQTINRAHKQLSAASFLPILNTISALSSPRRLDVLTYIHSLLHAASLSNPFTFSVLTRTQCALGDVDSLKMTLAQMAKSDIDVNVHHYTHLFHTHAFARGLTGPQRMSRASLVLKAINAAHIKNTPYLEAIHLVSLAVNESLEAAENRFRLLRSFHHLEPHPYTRLALLDAYIHGGHARHAARHLIKLMTGSKEKGSIAIDQSVGQSTSQSSAAVRYALSDEEMRRMLQALSKHGKGVKERKAIAQLSAAIGKRRVDLIMQANDQSTTNFLQPSDPDYVVELNDQVLLMIAKRAEAKAANERTMLLVDIRKARDDELIDNTINPTIKRSANHASNQLDEIQYQFYELMQRVAFDITFVNMDITQPNVVQMKKQPINQSTQQVHQPKTPVSDMPFHAAVDALNLQSVDSVNQSSNEPINENYFDPSEGFGASDQSMDRSFEQEGVTFDLDEQVPTSTNPTSSSVDQSSESFKPVELIDPLLQAAKRLMTSRNKKRSPHLSIDPSFDSSINQPNKQSIKQSADLTAQEAEELDAFITGADHLNFDDAVGKSKWKGE